MSPSSQSLSSTMSDETESLDALSAASSESFARLFQGLDLGCVLRRFGLGFVGASLVLLFDVLLSDCGCLLMCDDHHEGGAVAELLALALDVVGAMVVGKRRWV